MVSNHYDPSLDGFTPPGIIDVSSAALQLAKAFAETTRRSRPNDDWIVSYDWAHSRGVRRNLRGPMEELGAGLYITTYERHQIPKNAIQIIDKLEIVIKIPSRIWERSSQKMIDTDGNAKPVLVLR